MLYMNKEINNIKPLLRLIRYFKSQEVVPTKEEEDRVWHHIVSRIEGPSDVKRRAASFFFLRWGQVAAVILVPLLSVFLSWWYVEKQAVGEVEWVECFVPDGEIRSVVLPDHSVVTLNSGSSLFYPSKFKGKQRNVYLSGEAKFSVCSNKKQPFWVKTGDLAIEALGTVFNVASYSSNQEVSATLVEGKIRVDVQSCQASFILNPEEQILYNRQTGKIDRKRVRTDFVLAWEKGQMVFQGASLYAVINEIERRYGVDVYLNAKGLSEEKLTVKFLHDESLEDILYTLQQIIAGFKYRIEGNKVYIN